MKLLAENTSIDQFFTISLSFPPNANFSDYFETASSEITTFNTYKS